MFEERYLRNSIYIDAVTQRKIKNKKILFLGVGLASVIAECCLRTGFENFILIDKDTVSLSNLNRQNFTEKDIGQYKTTVIKNRLLAINPSASIEEYAIAIDENNAKEFMQSADYIINTVDFEDNMYFKIDMLGCKLNKIILNPYNLGYTSICYITRSDCKVILKDLIDIHSPQKELEIIKVLMLHLQATGVSLDNHQRYLEEYLQQKSTFIPQLSIGAHLAAALVTTLLLMLCQNTSVNIFPTPYYLNLT